MVRFVLYELLETINSEIDFFLYLDCLEMHLLNNASK